MGLWLCLWVGRSSVPGGDYLPRPGKSYDDSVPEHQRRTRDIDRLGRPANAAAGLALPGAFFAFLAALAGVGTHGLVAPDSLAHAPSFDAIFLLTAGAAVLGGGAGALVGFAGRLAEALPSRACRAFSLAAGPRLLGLLLPVTAGQWFAHAVLEADHMLAGSAGAGAAGAAALHGGHGGHAGHGVPAGVAGSGGDASAASGALAGGPAHAGGAEMVLPMLLAHAAGVLVCLAVSIIVRRALRRLVGRVTTALPRPTLPVAARGILGSAVIGGGLSGFAPAAPRAPPSQLALAA